MGEDYLVRFANALTRLVTSLGDVPGQPIFVAHLACGECLFFENSIKDSNFAHSNKDTICLFATNNDGLILPKRSGILCKATRCHLSDDQG